MKNTTLITPIVALFLTCNFCLAQTSPLPPDPQCEQSLTPSESKPCPSWRRTGLALVAAGSLWTLAVQAQSPRSPWEHPEDYAPGRPEATAQNRSDQQMTFNTSVPLTVKVHTISNQFSIDRDLKVGQKEALALLKSKPLLQDPRAQQFVQNVANRLVQAMGNQYNPNFVFIAAIITDRHLNAVAFPGGPMFLQTGLVAQMDNEAQLAGVIAHLMGHIMDRHLTDRYLKQAGVQGMLAAAAASTTADSSFIKQLAAQAAGLVAGRYVLSYFSGYDEADADTFAVQLMARAGYDPNELVNFYQKLGKRWRTPLFLKDHKSTDHIKPLQAQIQLFNRGQLRLSSGPALSTQFQLP